jgi:hypothetical protein
MVGTSNESVPGMTIEMGMGYQLVLVTRMMVQKKVSQSLGFAGIRQSYAPKFPTLMTPAIQKG